ISCIFVGSFCSLSMGPLNNFKIIGRNLFDLFDFLSGQIMLPIGGLLIALFVGWFMPRRIIWEQLTNKATLPTYGFRTLITLLKFFVPFAILMIFLSGIGLLRIF
ncbi:MAG: sodium-dependent transporter, partial [Bacteroidaceae bacterium]|nr:sodium-dependent transporter [Bacteroidaceae bacterium]